MRKLISPFLAGVAILALVGCGSSDDDGSSGSENGSVTLRLGYFPNITHSQPIVGLAQGTFAQELGPNVKLDMSKTFNAGPSAMEALLAGAIDATYVGPGPATNAFIRSEGALRIVAGATSGGALLIVRPDAGINEPEDFSGKKIASPQLGNTQDVALRSWLLDNGLGAKESGGDVEVVPTQNPDTLNLFKQGDIDGAWVPEPWATRLIQEAGGKVFLDERSLWPNGDFITTHLVVRTDFLQEHPDVVERLVRANLAITKWINDNPADAKKVVNDGIKQVTGASLSESVIDAAWANMRITYDPLPDSLRKGADDAFKLGFLKDEPDLTNIYALDSLNKVLVSEGLPPVKG
jgi:NitT/TauT family transport system substrate-binding protein